MRIVISTFILIISISGYSQEHRSILREGNKAYKEGNYKEAKELYEESFDKDVSYNKAEFNSGNAKYKNNEFVDASSTFALQAEKLEKREDKAAAYHNQGNSLLASYLMAKEMSKTQQNQDTLQMLQEAAMSALVASEKAFKNALRNNSTDDETRYNYALVKKLLEQAAEEGGGGGQGDQDKQDEGNQQEQEKDPNQEKSDQEQQQSNGEEQESDSKKEDEQDQKGDEEEGDKEGENSDSAPKTLSKQEAEQILEALKNKEQKLHQEMKKKKKTSKAIKIEKDW